MTTWATVCLECWTRIPMSDEDAPIGSLDCKTCPNCGHHDQGAKQQQLRHPCPDTGGACRPCPCDSGRCKRYVKNLSVIDRRPDGTVTIRVAGTNSSHVWRYTLNPAGEVTYAVQEGPIPHAARQCAADQDLWIDPPYGWDTGGPYKATPALLEQIEHLTLTTSNPT